MSEKSAAKELILLSLPTVTENIMNTLLQYVDTAMVGRLGQKATAAVSTTTTIGWLAGAMPYAVAIASLYATARENGAGNIPKLKKISAHSFIIALVMGLILTLTCISLSPFIPIWMRSNPNIRTDASNYFTIVSSVLVFRSLSAIMGAQLRGLKDTKTPMLINFGGNVLNMILNTVFIYVLKMGVTGAAMGSAISYVFMGSAMSVACFRREELAFTFAHIKPDKRILKDIFSVGLPSLMTTLVSCLGYVFFAGMVSGMGTEIFAAHSIAVTAEEFFYIPGYGLRTATSSLIGNAIGEKNIKKQRNIEKVSIMLVAGLMLVSGILLFFVAYPLMRIFTNEEPVARLGAQMLRIVAFTEPFFGLTAILEGIFYGMGKAKRIFITESASMWGIRILFTFFVTEVWHLGLKEVWYCMVADNITKAVVLMILYLRKKDK